MAMPPEFPAAEKALPVLIVFVHRPVQSLPAGDSCATLPAVMLEWVGAFFKNGRR